MVMDNPGVPFVDVYLSDICAATWVCTAGDLHHFQIAKGNGIAQSATAAMNPTMNAKSFRSTCI